MPIQNSDNHTKKVKAYFQNNFSHFGTSIDALGWVNQQTQKIRFNVLSTIDNFNDTTVLDLGCGFGDFWEYLRNKGYVRLRYTGVDITPEFIGEAKRRYDQEAEFFCCDYQELERNFDFILCSGAFNYRTDKQYEYIQKHIERMLRMSKKAIGFNLLSTSTPEANRYNDFCYYEPEKLFSLARKFSKFTAIRHDYLENDFTVFIYQQ